VLTCNKTEPLRIVVKRDTHNYIFAQLRPINVNIN